MHRREEVRGAEGGVGRGVRRKPQSAAASGLVWLAVRGQDSADRSVSSLSKRPQHVVGVRS